MYQNKYFKYKNKYLDLKKQLAGASVDVPKPTVDHLPATSIGNIFTFLSLYQAIQTFKNLLLNPDHNYRIKLINAFNTYLVNYNYDIEFDLLNTPLFNNPNPITGTRFRDYVRRLIYVNTIIDLPKNLTHLTFSSQFNQPIPPDVLPNSLTHLTFGWSFNQPLLPGVFPNSLTHLTLGNLYHPLQPAVLPNSLTHLTLGDLCQPLQPAVLPQSLTYLTFANGFNQPILPDVLSNLNNLTHLTFKDSFNQPLLPGVLPNSLTHLTFGYFFYKPFQPGVLPNSLTHLTIPSNYFKQPIPSAVLPNSLQYIDVFNKQRFLMLLTDEDKLRFNHIIIS